MQISIVSYNIEGLTLEYHFSSDPTLKEYIINKSKYLNTYLSETNADLICLQEFSPLFNISLKNYYHVIHQSCAIFFIKNKFKYVSHIFDDQCGLIVCLKTNDDFQFFVGTNRLEPFVQNAEKRSMAMKSINKFAEDNLCIFALDTNMRKNECNQFQNIIDCLDNASVTQGFYTYDKKKNPYFASDNGEKNIRTRYDRIYFSKNIFDCEQLIVLVPVNNHILVHQLYPFGGISDHYPLLALLTIN